MTELLPTETPAKNSDWAVIALISGIGGLTFLPLIGSLIAIISGYVAKSDIRRSMGRLVGEGMATWGLILGWVGIALLLAALCLLVFIPLVSGAALCGILPGLLSELGVQY